MQKNISLICTHCKSKPASLFHGCHIHEISEINKNKTCSLYKKGQHVFTESAYASGLYCINTGKIKLFKHAPDGKEQILKLATPGDFLGYGALLSSLPYMITAEVIEDAEISFISKEIIFEVMRTNMAFSTGMIRLLTETLDQTIEKMADIAYMPVRGRIAEALLLLKEKFKDDKNIDGIIKISRNDLASYVGTVKETAIRVLKDLKDEKLIEIHNHAIKIINVVGLTRVCKLYD